MSENMDKLRDLNKLVPGQASSVQPTDRPTADEVKTANELNEIVSSMKQSGINKVTAKTDKYGYEVIGNQTSGSYNLNIKEFISDANGNTGYIVKDKYPNVTERTAERLHAASKDGSKGTNNMVQNWHDISGDMITDYQKYLINKYNIKVPEEITNEVNLQPDI